MQLKNDKLEIASIVISALLPITIAIVGLWYTSKSEQIAYNLQRNELAGEYLAMIGDSKYQNDKKSLLMANLLREKIVAPELIFALAYRHQSQYGGNTVSDIIYEYKNFEELVEFPIGSIEFPRTINTNGMYEIAGWALDVEGISNYDVSMDSVLNRFCMAKPAELNECGVITSDKISMELNVNRPDVAAVLTNYPTNLHSGFIITLEKPEKCIGENNCDVELVVRLTNTNHLNQVIFDGKITFQERPTGVIVTHMTTGNN